MIQLKNLFMPTLLLCCFAGVQPTYAEVDPGATACIAALNFARLPCASLGQLAMYLFTSLVSDFVATQFLQKLPP